LKIEGSIPSSEARSKEMKNEIDRMVDLGIIEDARVSNGRVFRILSKRMFDVEEKRKWKNGVEKALENYDTKSDYAINSNDSKSGNISYPTIPMRILDCDSISIDGKSLRENITDIPGFFSFEILESYLPIIKVNGTLVMIENKESFLFADTYFPNASAVIYYSGRTSKRWEKWLLTNVSKIIFAPDYDPVGIEEYLRHEAYLQDKIELYMPNNLDELFVHGKKNLYSDQYHILIRLSNKQNSPDTEKVLDLIRNHKKGVEQEVIFRPINPNDG
jgi:hypothetical protein